MSTVDQGDSLTIFSLEDEPKTIEGSLDSLKLEGYRIEQRRDLSGARQCLAELDVGLILVDEHVQGNDDGGSTLIAELKQGALGSRNVDVPFGFVTGSRAFVNEAVVSPLPGFLGIEVKGGDLTRAIKRWIDSLAERGHEDVEPELRRVPIYVEKVERVGGMANLIIVVPAWHPRQPLHYPAMSLPTSLQGEEEQLVGRWFIARMNLSEPDESQIVIRDWEPQEPLPDDDRLA